MNTRGRIRRARSPAAEKQRRYRERLRNGTAVVGVHVNGQIVSHLVRAGLLPDHEVATRDEIGAAIAAALDPARRSCRVSIGVNGPSRVFVLRSIGERSTAIHIDGRGPYRSPLSCSFAAEAQSQ